MGTRPDALETVMVTLEILKRIPRRGRVTASELQEQLKQEGIDRELRSIQRLLESLAKRLNNLERDERTKPYGYRWLPGAEPLAVPNLTPQESLLLRLAEEQLNNLLPPKLMKSMDGFFAQARKNLGPDGNAKLEREWAQKVRVVATSQPLLPPKIAPGVFEAVSDALYRNHYLNINYRNVDGFYMKKQIMPLGLVQQGVNLYLVCRFEGYDDNRNLALHRILSADVSTLDFKRPTFDLKQYDADGRFGFGHGKKIRLSFCIHYDAGYHLTETPLSADQQVEERADDQLMITATVVDSLMLDWWLKSFGDNVSQVSKRPLKQ